MRTSTANKKRHRAHHTRPALTVGLFVRSALRGRLLWGAILLLAATAAACGPPSLPRPAIAPQATTDYVPVSFSPKVPPVEFIPPSPAKNAVWIDGSWDWSGRRWGWKFGTWVVPPAGARYARWVIVRRKEDGQLFFAPSSWKDASGKVIEDRPWRHALGPRARARPRAGGSAPTSSGEDETGLPPEPPPIDTGDSDD